MLTSLDRVAVQTPGAHEPKMLHVSKFRAAKPTIEDADVHICFARLGDLRTAKNATDRPGSESRIADVKYQVAVAASPVSIWWGSSSRKEIPDIYVSGGGTAPVRLVIKP